MKSFLKIIFLFSGLVFSSTMDAQIWPPICPPNPGPPCPPGLTSGMSWGDTIFCSDKPKLFTAFWSPAATPIGFEWFVMDSFNMGGVVYGPNYLDSVYVLGLGLVCLFITDSSGCVFSNEAFFPGFLPATPQVNATIIQSHCGYDNGSIFTSIVPSGFQSDHYFYAWDDGSMGKTLEHIPAGTYNVTVTVQNGPMGWYCPTEASFIVTNSDSLDLLVALEMDSSCISNAGNIDLTVQPPDLPYEYEWSNGATTQDLYNIPPGGYYVTVTGPSPCHAEAAFTIEDNSDPIEELSATVTPSYCDLPTGTADLTVIGGTGPFDYQWSNGEDVEDAMELPPGENSVTVTGFGGCSAELTVDVPNVDSLLTLSSFITNNKSCNPPDGFIDLTLEPEGNYSFEWLSGQNTEDIFDIPGGIYEVTITAGSCELYGNFTVTDQVQIPTLSMANTPSNCGQSTGAINLSVSGGVAPYVYSWSNGAITQDLMNIAPGIYSVTVTGNNGCSKITADTVPNVVNTFTISSLVTSNTSCIDSNGSIQLTVTPIDNYSFLWSNGSTSEDLINLGAGVYSVTLTQDTVCSTTESFVIADNIAALDTLLLFSASCNPSDTGTFVAHLSNHLGCDSTVIQNIGFNPLDTLFAQGTTCDPSGVGIFTQNLMNQNGCDSIVVTSLHLIPSDTTILAGTTCDPALAGTMSEHFFNQYGCDSLVRTTLTLLPSDATSIQSTTCDSSLAGVFIHQLTNQYGCDSLVTETIDLLPQSKTFLFATSCQLSESGVFTTHLSNQYGCDSTVTLTVTLISSDTTILFFKTCDPNHAGSIEKHFMQQDGCDSLVIETTTLFPLPTVDVAVTSNFNGMDISCYGANDGSIKAIASGEPPFQYTWSTGESTQSITSLIAGNYAITVIDANGCKVEGSATLSEPDPFSITFLVSPPACFDQHNGTIIVQSVGGTEPVRYSIDSIHYQASPVFNQLPSGAYQITAIDANDCEASEIILINEPLPLNVELGVDQLINLGDTAVLEAILNVPFDSLASIVWTGLDHPDCPTCLTQIVAPIITTTYSVAIINDEGCKAEDSATIFIDKNYNLFVPNVFSPNGDQINDRLFISAGPDISEISSFAIFDRWGDVVFSAEHFVPTDPLSAWDGTMKGKLLNPAVYAYRIVYLSDDGKQKISVGNITLVR